MDISADINPSISFISLSLRPNSTYVKVGFPVDNFPMTKILISSSFFFFFGSSDIIGTGLLGEQGFNGGLSLSSQGQQCYNGDVNEPSPFTKKN